MLIDFLKKLCQELSIELPRLNAEKVYPFRLGNEVVLMQDLDPGVSFQAKICEAPEKKREELFMFLQRANLLGQGTGGARIGVTQDGNFLTLSLGLPYELNDQIFKEKLEIFINYLIYWRDAIRKFERER
jgi:hypothetical protein